ncbi:hypothetical protein QUB63_27000 [Microcoleus sp. ARI1-B5]
MIFGREMLKLKWELSDGVVNSLNATTANNRAIDHRPRQYFS